MSSRKNGKKQHSEKKDGSQKAESGREKQSSQKRPDKQHSLSQEERDSYERKLEVKNAAITQLQEKLKSQKDTSLAMAADYKERFEKLKGELKTTSKAKDAVHDAWNAQIADFNRRIDELNKRHGETVKKLREKIQQLEEDVAGLSADLIKAVSPLDTAVIPEAEGNAVIAIEAAGTTEASEEV